mmetsp:Transcript_13767/g.39546  ORF Transcript_13767/g.39546 Transcript_13767/m.39546 type:complete len:242 (+) Transcript_13767:1827-2552(+)
MIRPRAALIPNSVRSRRMPIWCMIRRHCRISSGRFWTLLVQHSSLRVGSMLVLAGLSARRKTMIRPRMMANEAVEKHQVLPPQEVLKLQPLPLPTTCIERCFLILEKRSRRRTQMAWKKREPSSRPTRAVRTTLIWKILQGKRSLVQRRFQRKKCGGAGCMAVRSTNNTIAMICAGRTGRRAKRPRMTLKTKATTRRKKKCSQPSNLSSLRCKLILKSPRSFSSKLKRNCPKHRLLLLRHK